MRSSGFCLALLLAGCGGSSAPFRAHVVPWLQKGAARIIMVMGMKRDAEFPDAPTAIEAGHHYVQLGLGVKAFALAVLGGAVITLMTWMQQSTSSVAARAIPAITAGFLLAGAQLNHAIVNSLLMFAALHTGHAPFGYLQWAQTAGWAALGNIVGGVALVTLLRLLQVPHRLREEQRNPAVGVPIRDRRRVDT